jgi:hypothetical protein
VPSVLTQTIEGNNKINKPRTTISNILANRDLKLNSNNKPVTSRITISKKIVATRDTSHSKTISQQIQAVAVSPTNASSILNLYKTPTKPDCNVKNVYNQCRCGSKSHKRTNHSLCPLRAIHDIPCVCGSITHCMPTSKKCPLNIKKTEANNVINLFYLYSNIFYYFKTFNLQKRQQNMEEKTSDDVYIVPDIEAPSVKLNENKPSAYRAACKLFTTDLIKGKNVVTDKQSPNYGRHFINKRSSYCTKCKALMWEEESLSRKKNTFGMCCMDGNIKIDTPRTPKLIADYIDSYSTSSEAKEFLHICTCIAKNYIICTRVNNILY